MIKRFESVSDYVKANADLGQHCYTRGSYDDSWSGDSYDAAADKALHGDRSLVGRFASNIDDIAMGVREHEAPTYHASPVGSRVNVPAYLAGNPYNMRRKGRREIAARHVTIYVSMVASAHFGPSELIKRGSAILGLLEGLQRMNVGVDLYLCIETHGRDDGDLNQVIRVESRPLDLSAAGYAIAHPAFWRKLGFSYAYHHGFNGDWSRTYTNCRASDNGPGAAKYEAKMRELYGMAESDIYVRPAHMYDPLMRTPEAWIDATIQRIAAQ